jgi:hypothetical protein
MDGHTFDDLLRSLVQSRRAFLAGTAAFAVGWLGVSDAAARNSRKTKKRKRRRKEEQKKKTTQQQTPEPTPQPTPVCTPSCGDRTCGDDGCGGSCGACGANQACQGGSCVCVPEAPAITCGGRCGTRTNTCGQAVACPCPSGQTCLSNGSCATVCAANADCAGACGGLAGCSNPSIEGVRHCVAGPVLPTAVCTTTADCPHGSHCQDVGAKVCIQLCT